MNVVNLYSLPTETLVHIAVNLTVVNDFVAFSLLTSRFLFQRIASPNGLTRMKVYTSLGREWLRVAQSFYFLKEIRIIYNTSCLTSIYPSNWVRFPKTFLQVLHFHVYDLDTAILRYLKSQEMDSNLIRTTKGSFFMTALHFDSMFPCLIDLHLIGQKRIYKDDVMRNDVLEDFVLHLPRQIHSLALGYLHISSNLFANMPPNLTSLSLVGVVEDNHPYKATSLASLPECVKSQLVRFSWKGESKSFSSTLSIISSLPKSLLDLRLEGIAWNNELCQILPKSLTNLSIKPDSDNEIAHYNFNKTNSKNVMEVAGLASLPRELKKLKLSPFESILDPAPALDALPRHLTHLSWSLFPASDSFIPYPFNLTSLTCYQSSLKLLTSESLYFSKLPTKFLSTLHCLNSPPLDIDCLQEISQSSITSLHVNASKFVAQSYSLLPNTLKDLNLSKIKLFKDEFVALLPRNLNTISLWPSRRYVDADLKETALRDMPQTLTNLNLHIRMMVTGSGCSSDLKIWNDEVALDHCRSMLPELARSSFVLKKKENSNSHHWYSLTSIPTSITTLSVDCKEFSLITLYRFTSLMTLELGSLCDSMPNFTNLPLLTSFTSHMKYLASLEGIFDNLPPNITILRMPQSLAHHVAPVASLKKNASLVLPPSLTLLGLNDVHKGFSKILLYDRPNNIHTIEFYGAETIPPMRFQYLSPKLTSFVLKTNVQYYNTTVENFKKTDSIMKVLPSTLTKLELPFTHRVSDVTISPLRFPSLKHLSVGCLLLESIPIFNQDIDEIIIPNSSIEHFKSSRKLSTMFAKRIVFRFDINKTNPFPPSVTSFKFEDLDKKTIISSSFLSNLPKGLKTIVLKGASLDGRNAIASLPRGITTCHLVIPKFPESALDDLPETVTNLTLEEGIHHNAHLLPKNLTRLTLLPDPNSKQKIDNFFVHQLPRSITDLTLYQTKVDDNGISSLPPTLQRLDIRSSHITENAIQNLPTTITELSVEYDSPLAKAKLIIAQRNLEKTKPNNS
jgi:hypothetical protein